MNEGKTYYWFKYAAQTFPSATYVAKADMDRYNWAIFSRSTDACDSYIRTVYMEHELRCCMPRQVRDSCN